MCYQMTFKMHEDKKKERRGFMSLLPAVASVIAALFFSVLLDEE